MPRHAVLWSWKDLRVPRKRLGGPSRPWSGASKFLPLSWGSVSLPNTCMNSGSPRIGCSPSFAGLPGEWLFRPSLQCARSWASLGTTWGELFATVAPTWFSSAQFLQSSGQLWSGLAHLQGDLQIAVCAGQFASKSALAEAPSRSYMAPRGADFGEKSRRWHSASRLILLRHSTAFSRGVTNAARRGICGGGAGWQSRVASERAHYR